MNTPKVSIGTWACCFGPFQRDPWSLPKVLEYAADVGYDGVELNGFRPHVHWDDFGTPSKCPELKKAVEGFGLGISGYAPDFTSPAVAGRDRHLSGARAKVPVHL